MALRNERDRLRLFENALDWIGEGIVITDPALKDNPIIFANRAFRQITGYDQVEIVGRNCRFLQGDDRDQPERAELKAAIEAGEPVQVELRNYTKAGVLFWNRVSVSPIFDELGALTHFVGVTHDITDRKILRAREQELEWRFFQKKKMEALGTLAGGIAHDINNALVPVTLMASLLQDEGLSPVKRAEYASKIERAGRRIGELVRQILQFSRERGEGLRLVRADLVAHEQVELFRIGLPVQGVTITEDLRSECWVQADEDQIHRIVLNLLTNASQAVAPGEAIQVEVTRIEGDEPQVEICVSDEGAGMSSEVAERATEPFFTTREVGAGTGLGLSVVHGLVSVLGGSIKIETEEGQGTTVRVRLPAASPPQTVDSEEFNQNG
jgi:PAS domain S-box-containing protein